MKRFVVEFMTLDDGYKTTQGTAYIDGGYLVTKQGRGEFDVLNKITKFYTDHVMEQLLGDPNRFICGVALEEHIEKLIAEQEDSE